MRHPINDHERRQWEERGLVPRRQQEQQSQQTQQQQQSAFGYDDHERREADRFTTTYSMSYNEKSADALGEDDTVSSMNRKLGQKLRQGNHSHNGDSFDKDQDGNNSDDEHYSSNLRSRAVGNGMTFPDDESFISGIKKARGFVVTPMKEDGACLFRAVAFHLTGDQELHDMIREQCMQYMLKNRDHFSSFVAEDFDKYIERKSDKKCYGNHVELQAMSELFNRTIEVYAYSTEPMNTFNARETSQEAPIRVSYHGNIHYNAIIDPSQPTFGVGLGFGDLQPGEADREQMQRALKESDTSLLEQEILQNNLKESEAEILQREIEERVLQESLEHFYKGTGH
eukprot:m.24551 g.24551  ORF g.24551 m.24551 type:complete len:341 (-) comp7618_c0_seq1:2202-3224(-)